MSDMPITILDMEHMMFNNEGKESDNMGYTPKEHEELFEMVPVAIKYRCELCGSGYMNADPNEPVMMIMTDPPQMELRTHICDKCHGTMRLPKTYPYIEWITVSDYESLQRANMIKEGE